MKSSWELVRDEWTRYLEAFQFGTYLTFTWSDEAAVFDGLGYRDRAGRVYGHPNSGARAIAVVKDFLSDQGYGLDYFLAAEYGGGGRDIPHVHGVMPGMSKRSRSRLWERWFDGYTVRPTMVQDTTTGESEVVPEIVVPGRGMARILPVTDGCESYVTKYLMKSGSDVLTDFSFTESPGGVDARALKRLTYKYW